MWMQAKPEPELQNMCVRLFGAHSCHQNTRHVLCANPLLL